MISSNTHKTKYNNSDNNLQLRLFLLITTRKKTIARTEIAAVSNVTKLHIFCPCMCVLWHTIPSAISVSLLCRSVVARSFSLSCFSVVVLWLLVGS